MRGISEKELKRKLESLCSYQEDCELLKELIGECRELNPWLPIDENMPKDRPLLLLTPEYGKQVGYWFETSYGGWWVVACMPVTPTHYQELT